MALIEACVDSYASAKAAYLGGADRLELCGQLAIGGVTPSFALLEQIQRDFPIPIRVLIRPRGGDFLYSKEEREQMMREIELFSNLKAEGIVIGALKEDGELDVEFLRRLKERAGECKLTLHRAFDKCKDAFWAMEEAIGLGFDTILTSGQKATAFEGAPLLRALRERAKGRIEIMAGGGVRKENILLLFEHCGISCFHTSCRKEVKGQMKFLRDKVNMGFAGISENSLFVTDKEEFSECAKLVHGIQGMRE